MTHHSYHPRIAEFIGAKIRARRLALRMSQGDVSLATAIGDGSISRYERGEHGCTMESLLLVARALRCDPGDFLPALGEIEGLLNFEVA